MHRFQLNLTLRRVEGALIRVLGIIEHRGFRTLGVDGEARSDGDRWHLRLAVEGQREAATLIAQIAKLYDCLAVEAAPCR